MENIEVRDGARGTRYRVRWSEPGGRRSRTFVDEAEARAFVAMLDRARAVREGQATPYPTVAEIVEDHIERSRGRVQPSTLRTWRQYLRDHVPARVKRTRLVDLRTPQWQAWVDGLSAKGLAPATVQSVVSLVSGAINGAIRTGTAESNLLRGVQLPAIRRPRAEVWTPEQVRAVLAEVQGAPLWQAVYLLVLTTGMRPGELCALHWADLDRGRGIVHVRHTVAKDEVRGMTVREGTKQGDGRVATLVPVADDAIQAWREHAPEGPYLFGGEAPLCAVRWRRKHILVCAAAQVPRITLHQMRHTAATLLAMQGVHPRVASSVLGHASTGITMDVYQHVNDSMQRSAALLLADIVAGDNMKGEIGADGGGFGPTLPQGSQ